MENKENEQKTTVNIVATVISNWKLLLIVAVAASVVSMCASFLITPKFKSSVTILPTSSNAVSQLVLADGNYNEFLDATQFGDDMKIDQMLQILNSRKVKDHIIQKFNLVAHYKLDTTSKYWKTTLYKNLENDVRFTRTSFLGVEISVINKDPQLAATMANEIADYYDTLKRDIIRERTEAAFVIVEKEMKSLETLIGQLTDSLSIIMSHGIYDYETQSDRLTQQYAKEIAAGNATAVNRLKPELKILEQWAPRYISVRDRLFYLKEFQKDIQAKYQCMHADAQYAMSQKFVVEKAVASDKKYYPKKAMIVLVSTVCTLALAFLLLLCKDSLLSVYQAVKDVNKKKQ